MDIYIYIYTCVSTLVLLSILIVVTAFLIRLAKPVSLRCDHLSDYLFVYPKIDNLPMLAICLHQILLGCGVPHSICWGNQDW